jgi:hypothetical protein
MKFQELRNMKKMIRPKEMVYCFITSLFGYVIKYVLAQKGDHIKQCQLYFLHSINK